jgi:hypothetical protein
MPKGSKKGSPDIFVLIQGRCVLLEVKASADKHPIIDKKTGQLKTVKRYDGKQSPEQIAYQQLSERHGGKYYVVRSLQEAQHRMAVLIA